MNDKVFKKLFDIIILPDRYNHYSISVVPKYGIFSFIIYNLYRLIWRKNDED